MEGFIEYINNKNAIELLLNNRHYEVKFLIDLVNDDKRKKQLYKDMILIDFDVWSECNERTSKYPSILIDYLNNYKDLLNIKKGEIDEFEKTIDNYDDPYEEFESIINRE